MYCTMCVLINVETNNFYYTGGAGLVGALVYAALTEPHLLHLPPQTTLLTMLVVPAVFFVA